MVTARFLVAERTGDWAVAWRRELKPLGLRPYEVRSLAELQCDFDRFPRSLAAISVGLAGELPLLEWLVDMLAKFPRARFIVLDDASPPNPAAREYAWRAAGACGVARAALDLKQFLPLVEKHFALAPDSAGSWREQIMQRLPWPRWAASNKSKETAE